MQYIKDLRYILNDYIRLKTKELAEESMSQHLVLSLGPDIERTFKQIEVGMRSKWNSKMLLADYSSYRHMIENQIMLLNEGYDVNEQGNNPDPSPIDGTQRQETLSPEQIQQFPQPSPSFAEEVPSRQEDQVILLMLFILRYHLYWAI